MPDGRVGVRGGEPSAGVAELGEEPCRAQHPGAGQGGDDVLVGMAVELLGEGVLRASIWVFRARSTARKAAVTAGVGLVAGSCGAAGRGEQSGVQDLRGDPAGVALLDQPGAQPGRVEPVGPGFGEPLYEREADGGVERGEQAHGGGGVDRVGGVRRSNVQPCAAVAAKGAV